MNPNSSSPNFDSNEDPTIAHEPETVSPEPMLDNSSALEEPTDSELRENFVRLVKKLIVRILMLALLGVGIYYGYQYFKQNKANFPLPDFVNEETTPKSETPETAEEAPADDASSPATEGVPRDTTSVEIIAPALNAPAFSELATTLGLTSGALTETSKFIDFLDLTVFTAEPITKLMMQASGRDILTIYELPLPTNVTFAAVRSVIDQQLLANNQKSEPALFGAESFYFLWGETATTVFPLGGSVIGVHYALADFPLAKTFMMEWVRK